MGVIYRDGKGLPQDYTKAAEWFGIAADQGNGDSVRQGQVPGVRDLASHGYSCAPLDPDTEYRIWGSYINTMCDTATEHFNNAPNPDHAKGSYAQAFWNGYGVAAGLLRSTLRNYPVAPKVQ